MNLAISAFSDIIQTLTALLRLPDSLREMGPERYSVFKRELRQTMQLVSDELGRLNHRGPYLGTFKLFAVRIARTWPAESELRARIFKLASLIGLELP